MKSFIPFLLLTTGVVALVFFLMRRNPVSEDTHFHAGFKVYANGVLQDYSDLKYMHINPCTEENLETKDEQLEKAHLHDGVGDVAHIHASNATWKDLFTNLKVPIEATAAGFINREQVESFLDIPINPYDSLIIIQGESPISKDWLDTGTTREYIESVEVKQESC